MVVFVDQQSAMNALKAVKRVRSDKEQREIKWKAERMPKLGFERKSEYARQSYIHSIRGILLMMNYFF